MSTSLDRCPKCGAARTGVNPAGVKYCPNCGKEYPPGRTFCINCAMRLPTEPPQPMYPSPAPVQQPATAQQTPPQYQQQPVPPAYDLPPPPDFESQPQANVIASVGTRPVQYQQSPPPHYQQNFPSSPSKPPIPKKRKVGIIVFAVVVVIIMLLASGGYIFLTSLGGRGGGGGGGGGGGDGGGDIATLSAPTNLSASAGDGQVTISWTAVTNATSYNIYWSTTSGVTKTGGTKITGATSPYSHTGLTNDTTYYYVVTAVNSSGESVASAQVSATPTATGGNGWNIQTIDPVNAANGDISAAIDANDAIHVFYPDFNRGLKYATNKAGTWVSSYIHEEDDDSYLNPFCAIAVDGNNNVHIVYSTSSQSFGGSDVLYYATNSAGSWIKTIIAMGGDISGSDIAVDNNGKVHIAFGDGDGVVKYSNNKYGSWSGPTIIGSYFGMVEPSLALDSSGSVYIAYDDGWDGTLRLGVVNSAGILVSNIILDGGIQTVGYVTGWSPKIVIDKVSNLMYISYFDSTHELLKLYSAGSFTTISSCQWPDSGMALDNNGNVHICFTNYPKLEYATNESGSWVVEELPISAAGMDSDIVIESTGKIDIIYASSTTSSLSLISR